MKRRAIIAGLTWAAAMGIIVAAFFWPIAVAITLMAAIIGSILTIWLGGIIAETIDYIRGDR